MSTARPLGGISVIDMSVMISDAAAINERLVTIDDALSRLEAPAA